MWMNLKSLLFDIVKSWFLYLTAQKIRTLCEYADAGAEGAAHDKNNDVNFLVLS